MLVGDVSTGKTHMASALCMLACERRMEARFFTASSLVMRLRRARDEGRLDREAALIGCARLLVIDELGFLPLDLDGARALLGVRRRLRAAVGGHHHEPGVQPVGRGVRRRPDGGGRAHRQGHGHVGLAPAGLAEEHEVLAGADEAQRKHVVAAPALGEPHVRPVEPLGRLVHGEPRLPEQPCPPGRVPVRELGLEHGPAARHLRPLSCPRRSFPPAFARCRYDAPTTLRHAVWSAWPCSKPKNYRAQF